MSDKTDATETATSTIDAALNAAKARVAAKNGEVPGAEKPKRKRLTQEERDARVEKYEVEKAERKAIRLAKKAAKAAEYAANRKPAHMSKVEKAAAKLPELNTASQEMFNRLTGKFTAGEIFVITEHLSHFVRTERTRNALATNLAVGDEVRIKSGSPRFVGQVGTVVTVNRIRCFVEVPDYDKQIYLFTSDVEVLKKAVIETVPEDTASGEDADSDESEPEAIAS